MADTLRTRMQRTLDRAIAWVVPASEPLGSVGWWRDRMLGAMLIAYAAFGTVLIVPNVRLALRFHVPAVVVVDMGVYAMLLTVVLARRLPRDVRAWALVAFTWLLGAFFSWGWGGNAAGPLWLIAAPLIAGVIIGVRAAVGTLTLVGLTTLAIGVLASQGLLPWTAGQPGPLPLPAATGQWVIIGSNLLFLAMIGALGTAVLAWGLALQGEARERAEGELLLIGRALEQSADVVLLVDRDGRIAHRNRAAPNDTVGLADERGIDALGMAVAGTDAMPLPWRTAFTGGSWVGRCTRELGATRQHLEVTISPVTDPNGAISRALVVLRDVTREEALEERLRVSAKLEAVGTMASGIAHDFNNLLQPIIANAGEIREQLPAEHPAAARAADIESSASRGRGLVRRILTFSRGIEVPRVPTALAEVCEEAVRLTELLRAPSIALELDLTPDVWVLADPAELHHVLVNLVSNACDAMPLGGYLRIATRRDGADALLVVSDTGVGMDEATRSRMFVPFFSTKGPGRGTGLGLATVHGTITALGGTVDVSSAPQRGTTITMRLPALEPPRPVDAPVPPAAAAIPAVSHTLLVVDDDDAVRRAIVRMVSRLGYQVIETGDPRAAIALLREDPARIELLLTDLSMPNMTGIALAARARELSPQLPVILMTGIVDAAHADAARAEGVAQVVQKPFSQDELRRSLELALVAT